jgi:nucleoside-diphosphate-sugar epimerase
VRIAVTGAGGYVGAAIAVAAQAAVHDVVSLTRSQTPGLEWRRYDLASEIGPGLLGDIDAVVHAAYDLSLTREEDIRKVNVAGTSRLIRAASDAGATFCLISSMSAYPGTKQIYGRAKLASEAEVRSSAGYSVRLGLVYGGTAGGIVSALARASSAPVIPVIGPASRQFTVNVEDMALAMVRLVETEPQETDVLGLAHPAGVEFREIIRALARARGNSPKLITIPWRPVYWAMRAAEAASIRLPMRADSVLGLVRPAPHVPRHEIWERLGVSVRAFDPTAL